MITVAIVFVVALFVTISVVTVASLLYVHGERRLGIKGERFAGFADDRDAAYGQARILRDQALALATDEVEDEASS